jgi:hypothetical protein
VYQPSGRWSIWNLNEIYTGQQGAQRYVPRVNDYAVNTDTDETWKVTSIDPATLIPTLVRVNAINTGPLNPNDILLGVGPGTQSDTYRVYIDKSVTPHILAVDARLNVGGSMVTKAILFRGSELSGTAVAISALYDQSGNLLGQAIPLELIATINNIAMKTVPVCHTLADLPDGELITAVFYSDVGNVVSKRQLLAENTAFIRTTDASVKYIIGISLETPFLSLTDPKLIQYPLNVPLNGLSLIGVVNYSDGSQIRMPVDGTKFSIFGFEGFISTVIGQKFNVVLKYTLSSNEVVYGANAIGGMFITDTYKATTSLANGAFTVKLFGYPVWIDSINGYILEWFMYNLDRTAMYRVTPYVKFGVNSRAYNPSLYGTTQSLSVMINLHDVNSIFANYNHVQNIDVTLLAPGSARTTNWTIGFAPNQTPVFGINNFAATTMTNQNLWSVNLASGETILSNWLNRMYFNTLPLTDTTKELAPPVPNYFALLIGNTSLEFPISEWNLTHAISLAVPDNSTLFVKFFFRTPDNDIQLSIVGLPCYQQ